MPTIERQSTRARSSGNGKPAGSLLAEVLPVEELEDDFIKFVLYGQNGVGKTFLACQLPKPLLLISFEPGATGGSKTVKQVPGVHYIQAQTKARAVQLARELRSDRTFKTHVLDTCTSLQDVILKELMGLEELPVQLNWGTVPEDYYRERSEQAKEVMREYRDLPAHTVFIAQERDHNPPRDDKGRVGPKLTRSEGAGSFFAADLGQGTVKWMQDACDYIGRLYICPEVKVVKTSTKVKTKEGFKTVVKETEVETGRFVRRLRTLYHPNYSARFRSEVPGSIPEWIDIPSATSPKDTSGFDAIYRLMKGDQD